MVVVGYVRANAGCAVPRDLFFIMFIYYDEIARFQLTRKHLQKLIMSEPCWRAHSRYHPNIVFEVKAWTDGDSLGMAVKPLFDPHKISSVSFQFDLRIKEIDTVLKAGVQKHSSNWLGLLRSGAVLLEDLRAMAFDRLTFEFWFDVDWVETSNGEIVRLNQNPCHLRKFWRFDGRIDFDSLKDIKHTQNHIFENANLKNWSFQIAIQGYNRPVLFCILLRFPVGVKSIKWKVRMKIAADSQWRQWRINIKCDNRTQCISAYPCPVGITSGKVDFTITATIVEVISSDNTAIDLSQYDVISDL